MRRRPTLCWGVQSAGGSHSAGGLHTLLGGSHSDQEAHTLMGAHEDTQNFGKWESELGSRGPGGHVGEQEERPPEAGGFEAGEEAQGPGTKAPGVPAGAKEWRGARGAEDCGLGSRAACQGGGTHCPRF